MASNSTNAIRTVLASGSVGADSELGVDSLTLINLSRKHNSKIINALEKEQQRADVTELLKSAQRTHSILGKCAHDYGELVGTSVKAVETLYNEICKYEKKIEQLQNIGTLVRFVTQSRLRSKLDQLSNSICAQAEAVERYIKDYKVHQLIGDDTDEFVALLEEVEKKGIVDRFELKKFDIRRSFDEQKKIRDEEIRKKLDSALSIVKDSTKKAALMKPIPQLQVKPTIPDKDSVIITSKPDESEQSFTDVVCARSVSTYPVILETGKREGDPICDQYGYLQSENRTIAVLADGCSWGEEPKEAARKASRMFLAYMKRHQDLIHTTSDAAELILRAFQVAHNAIIQGRNAETLFIAGTTTMLELIAPENGKNFAFVCASIGDCKAYSYSPKTDKIEEITIGNRGGIDARDPGGRLGPTLEGGAPDLRNLILYCYLCNEDDIIFLVSDGVHDNLDPRQLGKLPSEIGIEVEGNAWDKVKNADSIKQQVTTWTLDYLYRLLPKPVTASALNRALIKASVDITQPMRTFMEENPGKRVPPDYTKYPGKVDHTSCLSFKVGVKKSWTSAKGPKQIPTTSSQSKIEISKSPSYDSPISVDIREENLRDSVTANQEDDTDPYTSVWDNLFGNDAYVLEWKQFIAGLCIKLSSLDEFAEKQLKMILDNSNTGKVNRFKFSEFLKGFGPLENCVQNVNRVVSAEWFFGFISAAEGKKFLELSPVGTFLIRFSGSKPGSFVLDYVQKSGQVRSVRLNSHPSGGFCALSEGGSKELTFKSLHEVVDTYKSKNVLTLPFSSTLPNKLWFFGDITAEEADLILQGKEVGTFLIRFSGRPGCFAACFVAADGSVRRGLLTKHSGGGGYQVEGAGPVYKTLDEIVQTYFESGIFTSPCIIDYDSQY